MLKIHTADDPILIGFLKSVLESEGIECHVRNELLRGGSGELPPTECWPELWVWHDDDVKRAQLMIDRALQRSDLGSDPWLCPRCSESIESQFTACWQCGSSRK
ncbi:MAG: hypothetical protein ACI9BW_003246 [Gammaproteobacteria bacterium]|jgi:hypothetical protein